MIRSFMSACALFLCSPVLAAENSLLSIQTSTAPTGRFAEPVWNSNSGASDDRYVNPGIAQREGLDLRTGITQPLAMSSALLGSEPAFDWSAEGNLASCVFGSSACVAGDVNGDGYSDLVVGAPSFSNGQQFEGRAFLYLGSSTGLVATPAWTAEGNQAGAFLGGSVSAAGDVNADGFDDVIIGASGWGNGEDDEGLALLFLGSASGLGANGTPQNADWSAESNFAQGLFGDAVAFAGDVNRDGFQDVIVGAPRFANGQVAEGAAFVYHGSATGLSTVAAVTLEGNQNGARLGESVSGGDVNGDGFSDVQAGATLYDADASDEGAVFSFHGSSTGVGASPVAIFVGTGDAASHLGTSIAYVGDLNGDGFGDVAFGAPDEGSENNGIVFARFGSPEGVSLDDVLTITGNLPQGQLGLGLGTAGDFNGDGYADLVLGMPGAPILPIVPGAAFVIPGSNINGIGEIIHQFSGEQDAEFFGASCVSAGDVNGDGFSDLVIGAPRWDNGQVNEGRVVVIHGRPELPFDRYTFESGTQDRAQYGRAVSYVGDVNADGFSDLFVGEPQFDSGQSNEGRAHVYLGSDSGILDSVADWVVEGNLVNASFGLSGTTAGDVNGDGFDDLIVSSPGDLISAQPRAVQASIYLGSATGLAASPIWTTGGFPQRDAYGFSVASAGDVNGDGLTDVLVGAPSYEGSDGIVEGGAFLFLGGAGGPDTVADWIVEGTEAGELYGFVVASAGDLNGDGYSDIAVGAPRRDGRRGGVDVYFGSSTGLVSVPEVALEGEFTPSELGRELSSAGDVNGDGFADLLVAASGSNGVDRGRVYLYLGSYGRLDATPDWVQIDPEDTNSFGVCVAGAGDVNLDGYSDVLISDYAASTSEDPDDKGVVWIYHGSSSGLEQGAATVLEGSVDGVQGFGQDVAGAGDPDGDGLVDLFVGISLSEAGGIDRGKVQACGSTPSLSLPREFHMTIPGGTTPIAILGKSTSQSKFRIQGRLRSAFGRDFTRFEVEAKRLGLSFDGTGFVIGTTFMGDTPQPTLGSFRNAAIEVGGLPQGIPAHFRFRVAGSWPFAPYTPWLGMPYNGPGEWDLRMAGAPSDAADSTPSGPAAAWLEPVYPNPLSASSTIAFTQPTGGNIRIDVLDALGRRQATLLDRDVTGARYMLDWDGTDANGVRLPNGVYFVSMTTVGRSEARKIVIRR